MIAIIKYSHFCLSMYSMTVVTNCNDSNLSWHHPTLSFYIWQSDPIIRGIKTILVIASLPNSDKWDLVDCNHYDFFLQNHTQKWEAINGFWSAVAVAVSVWGWDYKIVVHCHCGDTGKEMLAWQQAWHDWHCWPEPIQRVSAAAHVFLCLPPITTQQHTANTCHQQKKITKNLPWNFRFHTHS